MKSINTSNSEEMSAFVERFLDVHNRRFGARNAPSLYRLAGLHALPRSGCQNSDFFLDSPTYLYKFLFDFVHFSPVSMGRNRRGGRGQAMIKWSRYPPPTGLGGARWMEED